MCDPRIDVSRENESDAWYSWGAADVYVAHRHNGRWGRFASARCETPAALWEWMHKHGDRTRRNYVVAPGGTECAAISQLWDHVDNGKVFYTPSLRTSAPQTKQTYGPGATLIRRVVVTPTTFILDYARDKWRWVWLGGKQFFDQGEESLAASIGYRWCDSGHLDSPGATVARTTNERAGLWLALFMRLSDWWLKNSKAPFGLTASALSMGMLRTYVKPRYLCTHTHPVAMPLERAACFGGRAQTWYYGDIGVPADHSQGDHHAPPASEYGSIPGPMHLLDVRSMYPWLLREREFPRKQISCRENAIPSELLAAARTEGVIARVTIDTTVPEYPERVGDRIYYRTGVITTTLTGPEILAMRRNARILAVHVMATYHMGRPYQATAAALIRMREQARCARDPAWELFAKMLGNGLGGKLAQKRGEWQPRLKRSAPVRYGEWFEVVNRKGKQSRFRAIAGIVWEWVPDTSGAGPYTASFAYLAAYGRLHMRAIRERLPERSVVSMDTDGLWVLPLALDSLEESEGNGGGNAGDLSLRDTQQAGRFFGPRHYFTTADWVLAGFVRGRVSRDGRRVRDTQRFTACSGPAGNPARGTSVRSRDSELDIEAHGMTVAPDGWATARRKR